MSKSAIGAPDDGQILLYTGPNGKIRVDVPFRGETAWLTQKALAALFGVKVPAITKHLKNIFASGELVESAVVSGLETTAAATRGDRRRPQGRDGQAPGHVGGAVAVSSCAPHAPASASMVVGPLRTAPATGEPATSHCLT